MSHERLLAGGQSNVRSSARRLGEWVAKLGIRS